MSTPQHTPGPWQVLTHLDSTVILDATRGTLAEVFAVGDTRDQVTPAANARLIAAAPELLAAILLLEPIHSAANRVLELFAAQYIKGNQDGGRVADAMAKLNAAVSSASKAYPRAAIAKAEDRA